MRFPVHSQKGQCSVVRMDRFQILGKGVFRDDISDTELVPQRRMEQHCIIVKRKYFTPAPTKAIDMAAGSIRYSFLQLG